MVPSISNELGRLRDIVIHTPGPEMDHMTPDNLRAHVRDPSGCLIPNPDYLLFDDLVLLSRMRTEHEQLLRVLRATCGQKGARRLRDLLRAMLHDDAVRRQVIAESVVQDARCFGHTVSEPGRRALEGLNPFDLLPALVRGVLPDGERVLRWPLPNLMFTRDLAAVVGHTVLLTWAAEPARVREMVMSRALVRSHPAFGGLAVLDISEHVAEPNLEGGDVLVLSPEKVAIGVGERTDRASALAAGRLLLEHDACEQVYLVTLEPARSTMHLDTVFTLVDHDLCLAYAPVVCSDRGARIESLRAGGADEPRERVGSLLQVLADDGMRLTPVRCGGADPVASAREQWSDGANAFALAPGKILMYARNERTLAELNEVGFEVITPEAWCRNAPLLLGSDRRVAVALEGSELTRGRGGPRCLTLPLRRDPAVAAV